MDERRFGPFLQPTVLRFADSYEHSSTLYLHIHVYLKINFNVKQTINLVPLQLQCSSIKQIYRLMYFSLCLQVMKQVHGILGEALCGQMTSSLLQSYKTDEEGFAFYDDFLGNGDMSSLNKTIVCKENN